MEDGEHQKLLEWRFGMALWLFRDTPLAMLSRRRDRQPQSRSY